MYERVIREATAADDLNSYLNEAVLRPFHERLARVALNLAVSYGFALAGGYAVQAHGFLDRPSADVDLFAEASTQFDFSQAVDTVIAAYRRDGL